MRDGAEVVVTDRGRGVARLVPLEEISWVDGAGLTGAFTPISSGYWDDVRHARDEGPAVMNPWDRVQG